MSLTASESIWRSAREYEVQGKSSGEAYTVRSTARPRCAAFCFFQTQDGAKFPKGYSEAVKIICWTLQLIFEVLVNFVDFYLTCILFARAQESSSDLSERVSRHHEQLILVAQIQQFRPVFSRFL